MWACRYALIRGIQYRNYSANFDMDISKFLVLAGGHIRCLRCTAQSKRTKLQCARPALKVSTTQKCQFHGGRGSGPKTAKGKARIGAAHLVHGNETNKNRLERSQASLRLAQLEDLMYVLDMTSAARTAILSLSTVAKSCARKLTHRRSPS